MSINRRVDKEDVLCLVTQPCPTLYDPMDCSLWSSSIHGDSPGENTGAGCHALLQGILPIQGMNPGLLDSGRFFIFWDTRASQNRLLLGHKKEWNDDMDCHLLLREIFLTQESNPGLLHCRQTLYHLTHQGSPPGNLKSSPIVTGLEKVIYFQSQRKAMPKYVQITVQLC